MGIAKLLDQSVIKRNLKSRSKSDAIKELLDVFEACGKINNEAQALKDCIERENYLSTGFENGLAVPHAKTEAVNELILAFGISREGIEFDSLDGKPAHFIFLLLSPVNESGPHIKVLSEITRQFQDAQIPRKILAAESTSAILNIFGSSFEPDKNQSLKQ